MREDNTLRPRFYVACTVASAALVLLVVTVLWNDWIELLFRVDPDAGNGTLEWAVCGVLLSIAGLSLWLARIEWRRGHTLAALALR